MKRSNREQTDTPKAIIDTIAALKAERGPLAARLDAIDLAIENLSRVYGLNGTPQPMGVERRKTMKAVPAAAERRVADDTSATARRDTLLGVITKHEVGATIADIRKHTPKMDGKDRSNALSVLKALGKIKRAGNTWKAA